MVSPAKLIRVWLVMLAVLFLAPAASALTIDWVSVGGAGNVADTQVMNDGTTGYGAVSYEYRISKYETTNTQYAEFLNAVAATDTNDLYSTGIAVPVPNLGGISRSGISGSYSYSAIAGRENMPVNHVSFYDSARFANWLQNGQPTGAQDNTTTEDGAYTITLNGIEANSITRNAGATFFVPNETEWYKAAYYDVISMSYFDYSSGTNTQITCAAPGATANTANCGDAVGDLTDVGSYTGSASPNGTFDQGGNVWEWNETTRGVLDFRGRGLRGGQYSDNPQLDLAAYGRSFGGGVHSSIGFRLATVIPEPNTALLLSLGLVGLAAKRKRSN